MVPYCVELYHPGLFITKNYIYSPSHSLDEERQAARDELKNIVKNFLTTESKKIEGSVDQQVKTAVEALNNKIDEITDVPKAEGKGKKGK